MLQIEQVDHLIAKCRALGVHEKEFEYQNAIYCYRDGIIMLKEVLITEGEFRIPEFVQAVFKEEPQFSPGLRNVFREKMEYSGSPFRGCKALRVENCSEITCMSMLFANCFDLQYLELSNFNTSRVVNMSGMFFQCRNLYEIVLTDLDTSQVGDLSDMFYCCQSLRELNLDSFTFDNAFDMRGMFCDCVNLEKIYMRKASVTEEDEPKLAGMIAGCRNLRTFELNGIENIDISILSFLLKGE